MALALREAASSDGDSEENLRGIFPLSFRLLVEVEELTKRMNEKFKCVEFDVDL